MKKTLALFLTLTVLLLVSCGKTDNISSDIDANSSEIVSSVDESSSTETSSDEASSGVSSSQTSTPSKTESSSKPTTKPSASQSSSNTSSNTQTDEMFGFPTIELYTITEHHGAKGFFHEVEENIDNSFELELVKTLGLATDTSNVYGYETEYFNIDNGNRIRFITVGKNDNFKKEVDKIGGTSLHAFVKDPKGILEKNRFKPNNQDTEPKYGSVSFTIESGNRDYWVWANDIYVWEEGEFNDSVYGGHWKLIRAWTRGTTLDYDKTAFYNFLGGMGDAPRRKGAYEGECVHYFTAVYMDTKAGNYIDTNRPSNGTVIDTDPRYTYKGGGWGWVQKCVVWKWNGKIWSERYPTIVGGLGIGDQGESWTFAQPYLNKPERNGLYEGEEVCQRVWVWCVK